MGFGHRLYKTEDPRAKVIEHLAEKNILSGGSLDELLNVAKVLKDTACSDAYFVERKLNPNVDFYSGVTYHAMGLASDHYTLLFAMERVVGWVAHWKAFQKLPAAERRIWRPLSIFEGKHYPL